MTTTFEPEQMIGKTAYDESGDKLGKIGQVYLDDQTGQPTWATVSTGLFGKKESFAPLYGAQLDGDDVRLTVSKDKVKGAPHIDEDGHIGESEQSELYEYYSDAFGDSATTAGSQGAGYPTGQADTQSDGLTDQTGAQAGYTSGQTGTEAGGPGHDTSGPNTDSAMTRSEEQIRVGTQNVEAGRARLRKYVVTENVTQTVPVSHEEVRVEREPITDANVGAATDGPAISEEEHEVTLHAERPVVEKEAVPVERVRLGTETVTDQQQVDETVRQERIEVHGDDATTR